LAEVVSLEESIDDMYIDPKDMKEFYSKSKRIHVIAKILLVLFLSVKRDPSKADQAADFLKIYSTTELVKLLKKKYGEAPRLSNKESAQPPLPNAGQTRDLGKFSLDFADLVDFYNKYDMSKTHRAREFMNLYADPADLLRLLDKKYGDSPPLTNQFKDPSGEGLTTGKVRLVDYEKHLKTGKPPRLLGDNEREEERQRYTGDENYVRAQHVAHLEKQELVAFYKKHDPEKEKSVDIFLAEFSSATLIKKLTSKYGVGPSPVTTFYKKGKLVLAEGAYATRKEYITHSDLTKFYQTHDSKKVSRVDDQLSHSNPRELLRRLMLRYGSAPALTSRHKDTLQLLMSGDYKIPANLVLDESNLSNKDQVSGLQVQQVCLMLY
jgi:hypothetical protein